MNDILKEEYAKTKHKKYYGMQMPAAKVLVVNDPEIAKLILIKDFHHFSNRVKPVLIQPKSLVDQVMLSQMVFSTGQLWKDNRSTFSPVFSSGKMKLMQVFIKGIYT